MTAELRWIFLLLHFTAAAAGVKVSFVTVRDGDDVTLPCYAGTGDQRRRGDTVWLFGASGSSSYVTVFEYGEFPADVRSKSDRLRVTEKCSLVIEKVSVDDAGLYYCSQFRGGWQQGEAAAVLLSVVTMTEQKVSDDDDDDDDEVTLTCSVTAYDGWCVHSVQWLFDNEDKNMETSQFSCSDSVKIKTSEFNQKKKSLRCKVRDHYGNPEKLFEFKTQRSTGGDATTTKTTTAAATATTKTPKSAVDLTTKKGQGEEKPPPPQPPTTTAATTTTMMTSEGTKNSVWWVYLLVGVASVFLVVVVVSFLIRQNQVKGHDDDEFTTVTYSTVRAPPSSSSSDPRDLYAIVNKPKK